VPDDPEMTVIVITLTAVLIKVPLADKIEDLNHEIGVYPKSREASLTNADSIHYVLIELF